MWNAFQKAIYDGRGWREVSILTAEIMKRHPDSKLEIFEGVLRIAEKVLTITCGNNFVSAVSKYTIIWSISDMNNILVFM